LDALEDRATDGVAEQSAAEALIADCNSVLAKGPSPRALFIKGKALNSLAKIKRSNLLLEEAINTLNQVVTSTGNVPVSLLEQAGSECVDLMLFRGWNMRAIQVQKTLVKKIDDVTKRNRLGVLHLLSGQNSEAEAVFEAVLRSHPDNGFAMAHLGFILKLEGTKAGRSSALLQRGVDLLRRGIESGDVIDGKFFFHLGDGLRRLGRPEDADRVYAEGANRKVFLSFWQRSLYNVEGLKAQPVWQLAETGSQRQLETIAANWQEIKREALAIFREGLYVSEGESLKDVGSWAQFELYRQGRKNRKSCARAPKTCALIDAVPEVTTNRRGQVKFSVMEAGTHVHAHSGPTNCRLRAHLGLQVPAGSSSRLRVADRNLTWREGAMFVFDDSFDHEVWHEDPGRGQSRIVLILDIWHPDLTTLQKESLPAI